MINKIKDKFKKCHKIVYDKQYLTASKKPNDFESRQISWCKSFYDFGINKKWNIGHNLLLNFVLDWYIKCICDQLLINCDDIQRYLLSIRSEISREVDQLLWFVSVASNGLNNNKELNSFDQIDKIILADRPDCLIFYRTKTNYVLCATEFTSLYDSDTHNDWNSRCKNLLRHFESFKKQVNEPNSAISLWKQNNPNMKCEFRLFLMKDLSRKSDWTDTEIEKIKKLFNGWFKSLGRDAQISESSLIYRGWEFSVNFISKN